MGLFGKKKDKQGTPDVADLMAAQQAAVEKAVGSGTLGEQLEAAQAMRGQAMAGQKMGMKDMAAMYKLSQQMGADRMGGPSAGAPGTPTWLDAIVHPQSDFMRQCTCEACGGPKKLPSASAYMYCDYCSALVDYDLRVAIRGASASAAKDPAAYAATFNGLGKEARELKAAGDRAGYEANRRAFWDAWLTNTPSAGSHRIGDSSYRQSYVDYMAASNVVTDLDPAYQAGQEQITAGALNLRRNGMMIEADSLWPMLDAYLHQVDVTKQLLDAAGIPEQDPDRASATVRHRISMSAMAQGWLTSLSPEDGEELIKRMGLTGDYVKIEPVADGETRHCGQCGSEFTSLPGAKTAVCNGCGHKLDVGSAEWPCGGCGGLMTMPAGATETTCPYCKELVTRVGR